MKYIYSSIDIGSSFIKLVVCELYKNKLNLLSAVSVPSAGIKKGLITDVEAASNSVREAFNQVEEMIGVKISKVIASVPSYFSKFKLVNGSINIINEDNIITGSEVIEVLKKSVVNNLEPGNEFVGIMPIDFKINDGVTVLEPKNLTGETLSSRSILVTTPKKNIYSVVGLLESMGIDVVDISLNSIGDINVFKNKKVKESVGCVVNIGSETTTVSIYNKGIILKNSIIQLGGANIDKDLAYIYKINLDDAIKIKEKFALAHKLYANVNEFTEVTNRYDEKIKINQFEASEIAMSRIEEILNLAKQEINVLTKSEIDYIIISGGTSMMDNFSLIADEVFGKKVVIGNIKMLGARHNKYSSCIGNIIYFISNLKLKGQEYSMFNKEDVKELSSPKKSLINVSNESMLGKVFGYFLSE